MHIIFPGGKKMTENEIKYAFETVKKTVNYKNIPVLSLNVNYPVFSAPKADKKREEFVNKINKFYGISAERYIANAVSRYACRAYALYMKNGKNTVRANMNTSVPYADKNYISVFVDFSFFDGEKTRIIRLSQLWSAEKSALLSPKYVFDTGRKSKKYIKELIYDMARKNASHPSFSYYDNYKSVIFRKFDFEKFYFVPKGAAFFYDRGTLCPEEAGVAVFVLPFEKIDGVLKIAPKGNFG